MTRAEQRIYAFEGFHVDAQRRVLSRTGGDPIPLAPKVFDTLLYFVEHQGELLDKHALLEAIWPHVIVEENNLNQSISTLRRVLGERPGEHRFIVTEPGRGYRFVASVAQNQTSEEFEPAITRAEDAVAAFTAEPTPATSAVPNGRSPGAAGASALAALIANGAADEPAAPRGRNGWRGIGITAVILAVVSSTIVGTAVWFVGQAADPVSPPRVARFAIPPPSDVNTATNPSGRMVAVSPDGARLAFYSRRGLFVHSRERLEFTAVPGLPSGGGAPFFSPDGQWIGFTDGQTLKKVPFAGGPAVTITEVGSAAFGSWAAEGIVFANMRGLFRVSTEGGTPEPLLTNFDAHEQVVFPQFLPERRAILFTVIPTRTEVPGPAATAPGARVEALDLATGKRRTLVRGGGRAQYVPTGYLIYAAGETLCAVAFDIDRLEVRGDPIAVVTQVNVGEFALSEEGTLVYLSGIRGTGSVLTWVNRKGDEEVIEAPARSYIYPRLSPDGTRVALNIGGLPDSDISMWDLGRQKLERFTLDPAGNQMLAWSPDGQGLAFGSNRFGVSNMFWQAADGSGEPERLLESDRAQMPISFAPDGRLLFSADVAGQGRDIQALSMDGSRRVERLVDGPTNEGNVEVSPDGRWIAYDSDKTGQFEVYVRPYPDANAGGGWQISSGGGRQPLWSRDGHELFYRDFEGAMFAASVTLTPTFAPGRVVKLFEGANFFGSGSAMGGRTYDLSLDGSRFLMIKRAGTAGDAPVLVFVLNWFEELKRLVPVG